MGQFNITFGQHFLELKFLSLEIQTGDNNYLFPLLLPLIRNLWGEAEGEQMKNNQSFSNLSEGEGQLKFKLWLMFDSYLI